MPLLREGVAIGVIILTRAIVRPFTDKQVELVSTFADQALIAIENVRLFDAEQQRTRELSEALEQQKATSEVLNIISTTAGALEPVFETLLANATRLCGAKFGNLVLREDGGFRDAAMHNAPAAYVDFRKRHPTLQPGPHAPLSRLVHDKQTIHVADLSVVVAKEPRNSTLRQLFDLAGARTFVIVPMLKDNELIGAIGIYRQEVRPFSDKQIELVTNFAAQARHRHREHAAAQRIAPIPSAADGDGRCTQGNQQFAGRLAARVRHHAGKGDRALRGELRRHVAE